MQRMRLRKGAGILICLTAALLSGCSKESYEKAEISSFVQVQDKESLYEEPMDESVLYLTVGRSEGGKKSEHTWSEINAHPLEWYAENGIEPYECDVLAQFGNEDGPTSKGFGFGDLSNNATIRLSGDKASLRQQKSYKLRIYGDSGTVSGIKTLQLSKSFSDPFRFTGKLCFDLMSQTDSLMSVRTQFVHVYVKDETEEKSTLFEDYGLYTMTETVNKRYLKNRDLDGSGELYKIENFDFARHEDVIKSPTDPDYDKDAFESLLESKGSSDNSKLIKLLDAVNNEDRSIEEIVETYFDKDNLYTWMAFNILLDNKDTATENFYLYSPTGTEKFYILPWDNDGALRSDYETLRQSDDVPGWQKGIHLFARSGLFSRITASKACVDELSGYVDELHAGVLSGEHVASVAEGLQKTVKPYLYSMPDMIYARVTEENYDKLVGQIPTQMDQNYDAYYESLKTPTPFMVNTPEKRDGKIRISWEPSTALEGRVRYMVQIADSWDFSTRIVEERGIWENELLSGNLPQGQYFVRVVAESADGKTQTSFQNYHTEKDTIAQGVLCFYVMEDGSLHQALTHQVADE